MIYAGFGRGHMVNRVVSYVSLAVSCGCILALPWPVSDAGAQDAPPAERVLNVRNVALSVTAVERCRSVPVSPFLHQYENFVCRPSAGDLREGLAAWCNCDQESVRSLLLS